MTTESLTLAHSQSLAYRQSLGDMQSTDEAFLAQWYTSLKLALNTAQVTLEQMRSQVEETNSELAGVQYAQSELQILLKSGYLLDGSTPISGTMAVSNILSPGASRDHAYWAETVKLDDLQAALATLADSSVVSDETMTLEQLLAGALAGSADPTKLDGALGDALAKLYSFAGEQFLGEGWQSGSGTTAEDIMADPTFQARVSTLTAHLGKFLGDGSLAKDTTVAGLRQSIVGQFNVQMFSQAAMGSELGATILQYIGEAPGVAGATEEAILNADKFDEIFAGHFTGDQFSVKTLFDKIGVTADDDTTVDQLLGRLQSAHEAKASLSTLETLDLKVASQNYSNHLSLLTKMVSDRLTDVQNLLREW